MIDKKTPPPIMGGAHADMAVDCEQSQPTPRAHNSKLTRAMRVFGAAFSVILLGGFAFKATQLARIEVMGVPHISAQNTAYRIAPENPGGQIARDIDVTLSINTILEDVNNAPRHIAIAPPAVALQAEDHAMEQLQTAAIKATGDSEIVQSAAFKRDIADAIMTALLSGQDDTGTVTSEDVAYTPQASRPATPPPPSRPLRASTALTPAVTAGISQGDRLVQLGSFKSEDGAKAAWAQLMQNHASFLGPKEPVIQQAQSAGHNFYRLRTAGFVDLAETRRFCAALIAKGVDCIPVRHK